MFWSFFEGRFAYLRSMDGVLSFDNIRSALLRSHLTGRLTSCRACRLGRYYLSHARKKKRVSHPAVKLSISYICMQTILFHFSLSLFHNPAFRFTSFLGVQHMLTFIIGCSHFIRSLPPTVPGFLSTTTIRSSISTRSPCGLPNPGDPWQKKTKAKTPVEKSTPGGSLPSKIHSKTS